MSVQHHEPKLQDGPAERPSLDPRKLRELKPREVVIRFVAGALTSVCAGAVTLAFGARVGGIFLAFPAILAASLTLIEEQEDSADAREDARGALAGGVGLAVFAAVATLALGHMPGALALALAAAAWVRTAIGLYVAFWWR